MGNDVIATFRIDVRRTGDDAHIIDMVIHTNEKVATTTTLPLDNKLYERIFDTVKDIIKANA